MYGYLSGIVTECKDCSDDQQTTKLPPPGCLLQIPYTLLRIYSYKRPKKKEGSMMQYVLYYFFLLSIKDGIKSLLCFALFFFLFFSIIFNFNFNFNFF